MIKTDNRNFIRSYRVRDDGKLVIELGTGENVITDISHLESVREACQKEIKGFDKLLQNKSNKINRMKIASIGESALTIGTLAGTIGTAVTGNFLSSTLLLSTSIVSGVAVHNTKKKLKNDTIELAKDKKQVKLFEDDLNESFSKEKEATYRLNNKYTMNDYHDYRYINSYENTKEKVKTLTKA